MARGKKYRDVVGGHSKQKNKRGKKVVSERKPGSFKKRNKVKKHKHYNHSNNTNVKHEEEVNETKFRREELESSSESDAEMDDLTQLRSTFTSLNNNKASVSIESSEDSEATDQEEIQRETAIKKECSPVDAPQKNDLDDCDENSNDSDCKDELVENFEDPFVKHLYYDLHSSCLNSLQTAPLKFDNKCLNWSNLGNISIQIPYCDEQKPNKNDKSSGILEDKKFAAPGRVPQKIDLTSKSLQEVAIKPQIIDNLLKKNKSDSSESASAFTPLQSELFSVINNYQDVYFPERSFSNAEDVRFVYCLHAVNHILKTRIKILHHNSKLSGKDDVPEEARDQGLTRPKILMIVPFKDSAYRIINLIIDILLPENGNVMNKNRFVEEYTGNELVMPRKNPKPEDYELLFSGNTSDDFKIGLTVTKKSIKLFSNFYSSDIIVASPLGLRTVIGAEGEPDRDYDFLSSIELLICDQIEVFLMQNWDHFLHVLSHMHLQPKSNHGTDFSRVRTWSLNGWSKYYRQTLLFSSVSLPEINSVFNKHCNNYEGKAKICNPIQFGSISQVITQLPHVFSKFEAANAVQAFDARFDFFVNKILPQQKDTLMKQTLIYISSYFDFVRLRNYFKKEDIGFCQICEYSKPGKVARARDMFFHGDQHFLLYTERHHFFNRIRIKGIRHLVFYQPPNLPHFYSEMCNLMQDINMNKKIGSNSNMTVTIIYSKYDVYQLSAIVGTERAANMIKSDRNVHMLVTGSE